MSDLLIMPLLTQTARLYIVVGVIVTLGVVTLIAILAFALSVLSERKYRKTALPALEEEFVQEEAKVSAFDLGEVNQEEMEAAYATRIDDASAFETIPEKDVVSSEPGIALPSLDLVDFEESRSNNNANETTPKPEEAKAHLDPLAESEPLPAHFVSDEAPSSTELEDQDVANSEAANNDKVSSGMFSKLRLGSFDKMVAKSQDTTDLTATENTDELEDPNDPYAGRRRSNVPTDS